MSESSREVTLGESKFRWRKGQSSAMVGEVTTPVRVEEVFRNG